MTVRQAWTTVGSSLVGAGRFVRFLVVGSANTLVSLCTILGLKSLGGVDDVVANLSGYVLGLALSFLLNRRWSFRHAGRVLPALLRFLAVFATAYALNLAVVLAVIDAGMNDYVAHLVGMPVYTVLFYLGCRHYAFADPGRGGPRE